MNVERTMILNMLKEGKISVSEAESLLNALGGESGEQSGKPKTEKEEIKIDLEGMKAGLKSGMKDFARSMEGTLKSAMEGLKSLDLGNVVSSAFGSAKGSAEKELILSADGVDALELKTGSGDIAVTGGGSGASRRRPAPGSRPTVGRATCGSWSTALRARWCSAPGILLRRDTCPCPRGIQTFQPVNSAIPPERPWPK